jgi:transposase
VPLEEAITARSRGSWHLHADETTWRVLAPREGDGPAKWRLRVFLGPDTACFVMDPSRAGTVLARHAGIDEDTGQLSADDGGGPRRLVISSDFYSVYQPAGKKADGLVNLYCRAHIRRYFVRADDANPAQLARWTAAWLERIKNLYAAHAQLMTAWEGAAAPAPREAAAAAARLEVAGAAWDEALAVIDKAAGSRQPPPAWPNLRRKRSPPWTANGTGWPRTAATR